MLNERYSESDSEDISNTSSNSQMTFTVLSDIKGDTIVNYAIGLIDINEVDTLKENYIKIYLTKNGETANNFTRVVFTDITSPSDIELIDVSAAEDQSIVAWLDNETFYVSSMKDEYKILANTSMRNMFDSKSNLTKIDFSMLDTSNVEKMISMFQSCSSLTELNLSSFDTSKVIFMESMFSGCSNLLFDCSSWNVANVYMYFNFNKGASGVIAPIFG